MTKAPTPGPLSVLAFHCESTRLIPLLRKEAERLGKGVPADRPGLHKDIWTAAEIIEQAEAAFAFSQKMDALAPAAPVEASGSERDEVDRLAKVYADATDYYVQFHRGLSSPSSDQIRKGIRAVLDALRTQPSGETRDEVARELAEERLNADLSTHMECGVGPYEQTIDDFMPDALAFVDRILSARPLALEGQHSGGEVEDFRKMVEAKLAEALRADHADAPFPMDAHQAASYHRTRADLLGWVLDMLPPVDGPIVPVATPARAEAQDEGAAGERERIARIISPSAFWLETASHNTVFQSDRLPVAREKAFAKADEIIAARAHPSPTPAADAERVRIAVEALKEIERLIKISPDVPADDFDRGARAARFQAFDIATQALAALKSTAAKEGGAL